MADADVSGRTLARTLRNSRDRLKLALNVDGYTTALNH